MPFTTEKMEKVRLRRGRQHIYVSRPTPIEYPSSLRDIGCDRLFHPLTQKQTNLEEIKKFVASVDSGAYVPPADRNVSLFDPCTKKLVTFAMLKRRLKELECQDFDILIGNQPGEIKNFVYSTLLDKSKNIECLAYVGGQTFKKLLTRLFFLFGGVPAVNVKSGAFKVRQTYVEDESSESTTTIEFRNLQSALERMYYDEKDFNISNTVFRREGRSTSSVRDPYCEIPCSQTDEYNEYSFLCIDWMDIMMIKFLIKRLLEGQLQNIPAGTVYFLFLQSKKALEQDPIFQKSVEGLFQNGLYGIEEDVIPYLEEWRADIFEYADLKTITPVQAFEEIYFRNQAPLLQLQLHQDIIVTGINNAIQRQDVLPEGVNRDNRFLIGVLPRGGKTFIAGGVIREYVKRHNVERANVLWITAAPNETKSQVEQQLVGKFQDFDNFDFIEAKTTRQLASRTKPHAVFFVSSQLLTMSQAGGRQREYLTKLLGASPEQSLTLVFFDEAHKTGAGKSTSGEINTLIKAYPITLPFVFLTATYFAIQQEFNIPKANTYIWDYTDVISTRNLGSNDPELVKEGVEELNTRFGKQLVDEVLQKKLNYGQHLNSIAYDYAGYPDLFYLSADFNPFVLNLFKQAGAFVPKEGFNMTKIFETIKTKAIGMSSQGDEEDTLGETLSTTNTLTDQEGGKLLRIQDVRANDGTIRRDAYTQFVNLELVDNLLTIITPSDNEQNNANNYVNSVQTTSDPSFLSRIDALSKKHGSRFDITKNPTLIMFLPTGMAGTSVFYTLSCFASLLMSHPWWKQRYEVACIVDDIKLPRGTSRESNVERTGLDSVHIIDKDAKNRLLELERNLQCSKQKGLVILAGERLSMGISIPCADVVFMFNQKLAPDDLIQKMYRAVTPSAGKKMSFIVDLNPMRLLIALFGYTKASAHENATNSEILKILYETYYWDVDQIPRGKELNTLGESQETFQGSLRLLAAKVSQENPSANNQKKYSNMINEIDREFLKRMRRVKDKSNTYSTVALFGNKNRNTLENVNISEFMNRQPVEPPPRTASVIGISNNYQNNLSNVNLLNVMNRRPVEPPPRTNSVIGLSEKERNNNLGNVSLAEFGYEEPVRRTRGTRTRARAPATTRRRGRTTANQFNQAPNFANFPRLAPPEGRVPVAHYRPVGNSNTENEYGSPVSSPIARRPLTIRANEGTTLARNNTVPQAPPSTPVGRSNRRTRKN